MKKLILILFLIPNLVMAYDGRMGGGQGIGGFVIIVVFLIWFFWDHIWSIFAALLLFTIVFGIVAQIISRGGELQDVFILVFFLGTIFLIVKTIVKNLDKFKNIYRNIFIPPESSTPESSTSESSTSELKASIYNEIKPLSISHTNLLINKIKQCIKSKKNIRFNYIDNGVVIENILVSPVAINELKNTFDESLFYCAGYQHEKKSTYINTFSSDVSSKLFMIAYIRNLKVVNT